MIYTTALDRERASPSAMGSCSSASSVVKGGKLALCCPFSRCFISSKPSTRERLPLKLSTTFICTAHVLKDHSLQAHIRCCVLAAVVVEQRGLLDEACLDISRFCPQARFGLIHSLATQSDRRKERESEVGKGVGV
jgi:hypothetical protein